MTAALSIKSLTKVYNNDFQALKGIDMEVAEGDFFALLGPNGAGKSTTIGIICSLVVKTSGTVSVFGYDIDKDFAAAKTCIGVVPQEFNFNQFEKVQDIIINQGGYYGMPKTLATERTEKYLRQLGLWEKRASPARSLSGGMKRRLMIARALVHEPRLLILDEPTAGVDIELRRSMWQFLRDINDQGTTIILTTHYLEEAESLCRNLAIIDQGEIIEHSSIKELLQRLDRETVVLDLQEPLTEAPLMENCVATLVDPQTLEVEIRKGSSLNHVFQGLDKHSIRVVSMRNKSNRLEELFVTMVENGKES